MAVRNLGVKGSHEGMKDEALNSDSEGIMQLAASTFIRPGLSNFCRERNAHCKTGYILWQSYILS